MAPSAITPPDSISGTPTTPNDLTSVAVQKKLQSPAASSHPTTTPALAPLRADLLQTTRNTSPKPVPALDDPVRNAATFCTDHMITASWSVTSGWAAPELRPYGPLSLMPTASVLHYATECFEGLKAYRGFDGKLRLFRPDCNVARMLTSAVRISLPAFPPAEVEKLIRALLAVDGEKFLPKSQPGTSIYLRPTMIGSAAGLGVAAPKEAMLFVIATYMPPLWENATGMRLLASQSDTVRAWPGGFGYAKVGANYGPSLLATQEARTRGYHQILWLLGADAQVTEAGASNFLIVWRTKEGVLQLVTAPLGDKVILDGVTRRSVLQLARERLTTGEHADKVEVVERTFTMSEVAAAAEEGRLVEAFACGTAYFVSPVSAIHFRGLDIDVPMAQGTTGVYAGLIKQWLLDIKYGKTAHPWGQVVEEEPYNG